MWCSPDLLQSKEGYSYDVLAHNEFFELHHCKKVSTTIDLFKDIVMLIPNKIIPHKENEHHQNTFHIVLKGERQYVVAGLFPSSPPLPSPFSSHLTLLFSLLSILSSLLSILFSRLYSFYSLLFVLGIKKGVIINSGVE